MTIRRTALFALMITLVLLSACAGGKTDEERFLEMRGRLNQASEISFTADLKASYSDRILEYTLSAAVGAQGTQLTVLAPELVAGVRASLSGDSVALEYGGLMIDPVELDSSGVTPLAAPSVTVRALREGHVVSVTRETADKTDMLAVAVLDEFENTHTVWLEAETGIPAFAELQSGGRVVVSCTFTEWGVR